MRLKPIALALAALPSTVRVSAAKHHAVTGVYVDPRSGSVPLRQNINDLQAAAGPQWDLYIRALDAMQTADADDTLSYFQIAGIHGKPFIEWDDSGSETADDWQGYCPHNEKLFVIWHRPFVMLYEQTLVEHAKRIAKEYPERYRYMYLRAAETLRAPYWDWGFDSNVPEATTSSKIFVNMPDGERLVSTEIKNPLSTFHFPEAALENVFGSFDSENRTQIYRCDEWPKSYPVSADAAMANRPYKSWIYDIFTLSKDFADFATTSNGGLSLEQIHNGVHWDGGCGGQFLAAEFSAFDPLFWLHHSNVDRLWAYWQAINPKHKIFRRPYPGSSRFATTTGTIITPDSPLKPFRDADGNYHTTKSIADIKGLGYSYTGLEYWSKTENQMAQEAKRLINRLYGDDGSTADDAMSQANGRTKFLVKVKLDVAQVQRPASLDVYISGKRAGGMVLMAQPRRGIVNGAFPVDDTLEAAGIRREDVNSAVDTIQKSINVTLTNPDGQSMPIGRLTGLEIEIEDVEIIAARTRDELPTVGLARSRRVSLFDSTNLFGN